MVLRLVHLNTRSPADVEPLPQMGARRLGRPTVIGSGPSFQGFARTRPRGAGLAKASRQLPVVKPPFVAVVAPDPFHAESEIVLVPTLGREVEQVTGAVSLSRPRAMEARLPRDGTDRSPEQCPSLLRPPYFGDRFRLPAIALTGTLIRFQEPSSHQLLFRRIIEAERQLPGEGRTFIRWRIQNGFSQNTMKSRR